MLGMGTGPVPAELVARRLAKAGLDRTGQVPWQANRAEGRPGFTHHGARWGRVDATTVSYTHLTLPTKA